MSIVAVLAASVGFVAVFRKPLQRCPGVFYAVAVGLDLLLAQGHQAGAPVLLWRAGLTFHTRCLFAFSLFAIVMFAGVLKDGTRVKGVLLPIRAELSLVAALLAFGHIATFAAPYVGRLLAGTSINVALASTSAVLLVLLLVPHSITSVKAVKRRMPAKIWKSLQRYAYLFWGLVFAHVLLILGPSALAGADSARASLVVYTAVFAAYAVLRTRRFALDRRERVTPLPAP